MPRKHDGRKIASSVFHRAIHLACAITRPPSFRIPRMLQLNKTLRTLQRVWTFLEIKADVLALPTAVD